MVASLPVLGRLDVFGPVEAEVREDGMASEERVWQAARFLHQAHRERAAYQPIPDDFAPRDINEAYDIQEAFHELLKPEQESWGGWVATFKDPDGNVLQLLQLV